jgi:hypothetical protein
VQGEPPVVLAAEPKDIRIGVQRIAALEGGVHGHPRGAVIAVPRRVRCLPRVVGPGDSDDRPDGAGGIVSSNCAVRRGVVAAVAAGHAVVHWSMERPQVTVDQRATVGGRRTVDRSTSNKVAADAASVLGKSEAGDGQPSLFIGVVSVRS